MGRRYEFWQRERERERLIELLLLTRRPAAGHSRRHYDSSHPTYQNLVILFPLLTPSFPPLLLLLPLLFSTLSALFSSMLHASGLVNCLIVSECSQNVLFRGRKLTKFLRRGTTSSQTPPYWRGGHPLPKLHPLGAYGARPVPLHSKILDPPLCFRRFRCITHDVRHFDIKYA